MDSIKVTSLTFHNIAALGRARDMGLLPEGTVVNATTAIFPATVDETIQALYVAKSVFNSQVGSSRNASSKSLCAVIRKVAAKR